MRQLFITTNSLQATIIRLTLALVILPHGAQKALGIFGGYGFEGTMGYFTDAMHLPYLLGLIVIVTEFLGAISIALGFATRIWSALMICLFLGIIYTSHWETGFFMDWSGENPKPNFEGFEYHLLVLGMSASLILSGSGRYSIDRLISNPAPKTSSEPFAPIYDVVK